MKNKLTYVYQVIRSDDVLMVPYNFRLQVDAERVCANLNKTIAKEPLENFTCRVIRVKLNHK